MSKKKNDVVPGPKTLEEAFDLFDQTLTDKERTAIMEGEDCHFGLGLWIRNNWFYDNNCEGLLAEVQRAVSGEENLMTGPDGKVMFIGDGDFFSSTIINLYRDHLLGAS